MYLMNFPTRTAPAARQLSGCSGFFAPRTPLTRQGTPPRWTPGREIPPFFYAGWGPQKTHWTHWPRSARPCELGGGRYLRFLRGVGAQKTHWTHWPPRCPPRPLPVHDLAPEVPRLPRYGHPGPKGVRPPCPPCRGPQAATLRPGGCPALSR